MNKPLVLVVEDDTPVRNLITTTLKTHEYRYLSAQNGASAVLEALSHNPDIVLLDLGLPDMDGVEIIRKIRSWSNMPIIVISARTEDSDKIGALDAGADDYVTKPFGIMELVSRIKAVLRRTQKDTQDPQDVIVLGDIEMNTKKHEVTADGEVVTLTLKEYELLKRLMKNPNIVMTRDCLLEDIWGYDFDGETRTVDVHVRTLRQKLGKSGEKIETVRGVGYRMSE